MNKISILLFLFLTISVSLFSNDLDKNKVYNNIIKKYGTINTIYVICDAAREGINNIEIKAKRGNNYKIKTKNREIITDGKTTWIYSLQKKSVIISNYTESNESISLDKIFFDIIPNLQPIALKSVLSNNKNKQYRLDLNNNDKSNEIKGIYLYLDNKLTKIESVEVISNNDKYRMKWNIKKIEINKTMLDSVFIFKIPTGVEEIDTR